MSRHQKPPTNYGSPLAYIGERIRYARIRAGLTQEELAGGDITRNMISRIETGAALPSLPTLCALADKLNLPAGALLSDLNEYDAYRLTAELRSLLIKKRYAQILERFEISGVNVTDELAYILYCANVSRAWELYEDGKLNEALKRLAAAEIYAGLTDADIISYERNAKICRMLISLHKETAEKDKIKYDEELGELIFRDNEYAIYLYVRNILSELSSTPKSVPDDDTESLLRRVEPLVSGLPDDYIRAHILAMFDMARADYLSAKSKLVPYTEPPSKLPPTFLFDFYTDLELCCKCCGDFENAYKYASRKLALIQKIK
jgi:transcriptional regulator with XRE-family HTH domain